MNRRMKKNTDLYIGGGIVLVFLLLGLFINNARSMLITAMAINILFGMSFSLLFAYTGMTSMGHAVYYGMGSYFMMICIIKLGIHPVASALISLAATSLLAVFLGTVCLKNGMLAFSFISMGIANTMTALFNKWSFVGTDVGLQMNFLPEWLMDYRVKYYVIVGTVAIVGTIFYLFTKSPFVMIAKGIRENEERLKFLGLNTKSQRLKIFVVSAFFASIAGVLYCVRSTGAYPAQLTNESSILAIMMCMVGGTETFWGPILGGVIITLFVNFVSGLTIYYQGFLGAFVLLVVFVIRDGLISRRMANWIRKLFGKEPIGVKKEAEINER